MSFPCLIKLSNIRERYNNNKIKLNIILFIQINEYNDWLAFQWINDWNVFNDHEIRLKPKQNLFIIAY